MKKAFTMIELIFVIVILGILAAVAIPRLAATRDDAEIGKAMTNLTTIITDVAAYYMSQGEFANDFPSMTYVHLSEDNQLIVRGKKCIKFSIKDDNETLVLSDGDESSDEFCQRFLSIATIQSMKKEHRIAGLPVKYTP